MSKRKVKGKVVNVTAELVYNSGTGETFLSDYGKEFKPDFDEDNDDFDLHYTNPNNLRNHWQHEVRELPIKDLKKFIEEAESAGANKISIFYHGDHCEYKIYGFNFHHETYDEFKHRNNLELIQKSLEEEEAKIKLRSFAAEYGLKVNFE